MKYSLLFVGKYFLVISIVNDFMFTKWVVLFNIISAVWILVIRVILFYSLFYGLL